MSELIPITVSVVANFLQKEVNWTKFVNLVTSIGPQFNDAQWRFLKAIVFEKAVEAFSEKKLVYVSQVGCDFIIPSLNNAKVEMKYTEDVLYTEKSRIPRKNAQSITLMNSKGTNSHTGLPDEYADFILIVGRRGAAIVDKPTISSYIKINGDSITATIPTDKMTFIFTPDTVTATPDIQSDGAINLRQTILDAISDALTKI
jgi:hypothetical protein